MALSEHCQLERAGKSNLGKQHLCRLPPQFAESDHPEGGHFPRTLFGKQVDKAIEASRAVPQGLPCRMAAIPEQGACAIGEGRP